MPQRMLNNDDFGRGVFELICRYIDDKCAIGEPSMRRPSVVLLISAGAADVLKAKYSHILKVGTKQ